MGNPRQEGRQGQVGKNRSPLAPISERPDTDLRPPKFFPFIQFEFAFNLEVADGRYIVRREHVAANVIVFGTSGATGRKRFKKRRRSSTDADDAVSGPSSTVTVVLPDRFADEQSAARWLADRSGDADEAEHEIEKALKLLNEALAAHRIASSDPYVSELGRDRAVTVKIGFGRGEEIAYQKWSEAMSLPEPQKGKRRRRQILDPQDKFAAILSGRETALLAEELLLRAKLDMQMNRLRHAALQADLALEALLAEQQQSEFDEGKKGERQASDLNWLRSQESSLEQIANSALSDNLEPESAATIEEIVERIERFLRRRRYG